MGGRQLRTVAWRMMLVILHLLENEEYSCGVAWWGVRAACVMDPKIWTKDPKGFRTTHKFWWSGLAVALV